MVYFAFQHHGRSTSFPSQTQPDYIKAEIELNKIKTWESSCLSCRGCVSSDTIQTGLVGLAELYNCVHDLMGSPTTQQTIMKHHDEPIVEEVVEGSLIFIDCCGKIKELLASMREHLQELESAMRTKGGDSSIQNNINAYINLRKRIKKDVIKNLKILKQKDVLFSPILIEDQQLALLIKLLREVFAATTSVFKTILHFLGVEDLQIKFNGWSSISKMMISRSKVNGRELNSANEVKSIDIILGETASIKNSKFDVQVIVRMLKSLDAKIQGLESGMDLVFRKLIKNRVCFLNMITF
ncbi:hypothetical protein Leryth_006978 [Lithospermum erythrorhizon]|nr:hypothetical protein Leryth_006978 [Lithospermum erythrorhizon]